MNRRHNGNFKALIEKLIRKRNLNFWFNGQLASSIYSIPDWLFEEGVVFLPEEIETGLRTPKRSLRRLFREVHGELFQVEY